MLNTGFEFALSSTPIRNSNFTWTTSINGSFNHNEVTKLSNELYSTSRLYVGDVGGIRGMSATTSSILEEGYPVGQFYMLKSNGIDENGKYIIEDITGEGEITDADRTYVGDAQPDFVFGWQNTFNYKKWDLSFFFRGTVGNDVLNIGKIAYSNSQSLIGANVRKEALKIGLTQAPQMCSYYVEDGSHIRLDNLSIGYNFDTSRIGWLNNARVYITGQNLFVITNYTGLDPEVRMDGVDPGKEEREFYPKPRTFSLGVSLSF
jgi:iron complex outermembrane receptor protein